MVYVLNSTRSSSYHSSVVKVPLTEARAIILRIRHLSRPDFPSLSGPVATRPITIIHDTWPLVKRFLPPRLFWVFNSLANPAQTLSFTPFASRTIIIPSSDFLSNRPNWFPAALSALRERSAREGIIPGFFFLSNPFPSYPRRSEAVS